MRSGSILRSRDEGVFDEIQSGRRWNDEKRYMAREAGAMLDLYRLQQLKMRIA